MGRAQRRIINMGSGGIMREFTKIPISEAIKIPGNGFHNHLVNRYWAVTDNDEILILAKYGSAQCNEHKEIVQGLVDRAKDYPATKVVFLESVWLSHDCSNYC